MEKSLLSPWFINYIGKYISAVSVKVVGCGSETQSTVHVYKIIYRVKG